jgi:hypothetical protein
LVLFFKKEHLSCSIVQFVGVQGDDRVEWPVELHFIAEPVAIGGHKNSILWITARVGAKTGSWGIGPFSEKFNHEDSKHTKISRRSMGNSSIAGHGPRKLSHPILFLREFLRVLCAFVVKSLAFSWACGGIADLPGHQGNRVKEESSSFLKKRTKKLLLIGRAPAALRP